VPTATSEKGLPTPLPLSVTIEPKAPTFVKGKGSALKIRQWWEGTVTRVTEENFIATLVDKTNPAAPDEQAVFEFSSFEVPDDDKPLLKPGSVFYFVMGTQTTYSGQVISTSALEFRRLPKWTRRSLDVAQARASRLHEWLETTTNTTTKEEHSSSPEN
jgi:hypothetical protein